MPSEKRSRTATPLIDVVAFGLVVAVLGIQAVTSGARLNETGSLFDAGAAALLAVGLVLAWTARRFPATGALGNLVVTVIWYQVGYVGGIVNLPYLIAFYFLGASGDRRRQLVVAGIAVALTGIAMVASGESATSVVTAVGWTITAVVLGELTFSHRRLVSEYEQRAVLAETERDLEAERRVARVREEIARDLHDVLAHTVSVMSVQAAVAQDSLTRGSGQTEVALRAIRSAGAAARSEIEALLSVTRSHAGPGIPGPAPRLVDLPALAQSAGSMGLEVSFNIDVPPGALSDAGELTVYRVVQEALTNVARHCGSPEAEVTVNSDGSLVHIAVRDRGRSPAVTWVVGSGLTGMRERVESLGGEFTAGPDPGGGWQVSASLPVERTCQS